MPLKFLPEASLFFSRLDDASEFLLTARSPAAPLVSELEPLGTPANDTLDGGPGDDSLDGEAGNDVLSGLAGADTLIGGKGADALDGGEGDDQLIGEAGRDTLIGGAGNDLLRGDGGNDSIDGGEGDGDVLNYRFDDPGAFPGGVAVAVSFDVSFIGQAKLVEQEDGFGGIDTVTNIEVVSITGTAFNDTFIGSQLDDQILGQGGQDTLVGNVGRDTLNGGSGNDSLEGGEGDDVYMVDSSGDQVVEAADAGVDTISTSLSLTLPAEVDHLTLTGSGNRSGTGNALANQITGNGGNNALRGQGDADTLSGAGGQDTLTGGAGDDSLTGGGGADQFVLGSLSGSDTLTDFVSGTDKIVVSQAGIAVGNGNTTINGAVKLAGPGGFSATAELVIISGNIAGDITKSLAATQIGSANNAYAVGRDVLFAVDNGSSTALYLFTAADANAVVSSSELTLLATLTTTAATSVGDFLFGG